MIVYTSVRLFTDEVPGFHRVSFIALKLNHCSISSLLEFLIHIKPGFGFLCNYKTDEEYIEIYFLKQQNLFLILVDNCMLTE